jgi:DNA-binding NarL/FixJ family response regulator
LSVSSDRQPIEHAYEVSRSASPQTHEERQGWVVVTVLVLHAQGLVRRALEDALSGAPGLALLAAGSADEAVRASPGARPDVVVTDARTAVSDPSRRPPAVSGARWLVQVGAHETEVVPEVLVAGASGLFSDHAGHSELVAAVRHVAAGRGWLCPELVPALVRELVPYHRRRVAARGHLDGLGPAELRLLALLARGSSNAEIAAELHLAVSTVKDYVGALLSRLGTTRSEAIALAVRAEITAVAGRSRS